MCFHALKSKAVLAAARAFTHVNNNNNINNVYDNSGRSNHQPQIVLTVSSKRRHKFPTGSGSIPTIRKDG